MPDRLHTVLTLFAAQLAVFGALVGIAASNFRRWSDRFDEQP